MQYKKIAVFCGSKNGNNSIFVEHARQLGKLMAAKNMDLVYGGGNVGIMGAVANAVLDNGGKVTGIIPKVLVEQERQHLGLTELKVVDDMHTRKKMIYEMCDAAIVLPGGNGTMDELFEMLTWNNLRIHNKKIILLNSAGYYYALIVHLQNMQHHGFLYESWDSSLRHFATPTEVIAFLDEDKN
ncbi:TIGR00730 family Rossman fold protein [Hydrotalea sp.]|uniref:LOG family protein n=1 Tax=Hydrotalea sp. TaxID=2881279 RepID=UPI00261CB587|nr:TIGR00730 family Rossman fold protein [Hydrotalea sp.]